MAVNGVCVLWARNGVAHLHISLVFGKREKERIDIICLLWKDYSVECVVCNLPFTPSHFTSI